MIKIRPFNTLGHANHGWLNAKHHFSFGSYLDPQYMQWGRLRVWNDDIIDPGTGFGTHPHKNMEIVTYVYKGAITHTDNLGNTGRIETGDVQVMSAGTGVRHSEYNHEEESTRIFQIWLLPDKQNQSPSWTTQHFPKEERSGKFVPFASGLEDNGSVAIHTDARVLGASLRKGQTTTYTLTTKRLGYLVSTLGSIEIEGEKINAHDGVIISHTNTLTILALDDTEVILVDTAP